jgi:hypothetical protein
MEFEDERTGTWHAYGRTAPPPAKSLFEYNSFRAGNKLALVKPTPGTNCHFAALLGIHFPEVAASIDEDDSGVLHLEVGVLTRATRDAIRRRDWPTVARHFAFVDSVLETADTKLHDAIGVSYLGNLFYSETSLNYAKARTLMPERLSVALEIIERHYEELTH